MRFCFKARKEKKDDSVQNERIFSNLDIYPFNTFKNYMILRKFDEANHIII